MMMSGRRWVMVLLVGGCAACERAPEVPVAPGPPASGAAPVAQATTAPVATAATAPATAGSPGATLCAELSTLVEAARKNFPGLRRQDRPVSIDGSPGFESMVTVAGTAACRILTSEAPYPDAYECDLARAESRAQAKATVERWASVVATCPVVSTWRVDTPSELGRSWHIETGDNHELVVRVIAAGNDGSRPTLVVRRNEI